MYEKERSNIIAHGFLPSEADAFINAKGGFEHNVKADFDKIYNSVPFQKMLADRSVWVTKLRSQGYNGNQIQGSLRHYYALKGGRSPFDFLKIEYTPPKVITDFLFASKVRAKARVNRMSAQGFETRYTKKIKTEWRPNEPTPPKY
jgi:hypothetical protein